MASGVEGEEEMVAWEMDWMGATDYLVFLP
jgi:hypothetical protein